MDRSHFLLERLKLLTLLVVELLEVLDLGFQWRVLTHGRLVLGNPAVVLTTEKRQLAGELLALPHRIGQEAAAERADLRLLALCFILGVTSWTGLCRLLRGETLKLRELEYVEYRVAPRNGSTGRVATSDAQIRLAKLNQNFGHVGLRYAQFLGTYHSTIAADMAALASQVEVETGASQEERYWVATISCLLLGARYANHVGYKVFDEVALKEFLYTVLAEMRSHRKEQTVDLDQSLNVSAILNRFFNDVKKNGSWLVTSRIHVGVGKPAKTGPAAVNVNFPSDLSRLNGVDVQVGIANSLLRISSSALGKWCKANEINKVNLIDALAKQVSLTNLKNARMGAGTVAAGTNEHIFEIDLQTSKDLDFVSDMV